MRGLAFCGIECALDTTSVTISLADAALPLPHFHARQPWRRPPTLPQPRPEIMGRKNGRAVAAWLVLPAMTPRAPVRRSPFLLKPALLPRLSSLVSRFESSVSGFHRPPCPMKYLLPLLPLLLMTASLR